MCRRIDRDFLLQMLNQYYIDCETYCTFCNNCYFCIKREFNTTNKKCNQWFLLYHKSDCYSITL